MTDIEKGRGRQERMYKLLTAAFAPEHLTIEDESHLHVGHAGAASGGGHYQVRIVSAVFAGLSRVRRHQLVYQVLEEMINGEIHALGISAKTPQETAAQRSGSTVRGQSGS